MVINMMCVKATCSGCKYVFNINATNVKEELVTIIEDGKVLLLTYYQCPKCGKLHVVQIDDDISKEMLLKLKLSMKQASRKHKKGKKYRKPPMIEEKEKLLLNRGSLNSKYAGKHFLYEGNEKELCLMKIS